MGMHKARLNPNKFRPSARPDGLNPEMEMVSSQDEFEDLAGIKNWFRFAQTDLLPPLGKRKEWLLTNGIGGFAASTISGINTRRYHGLLVAALRPPVDRRLMLAKCEEEVFIDDRKHSLFSSETLGGFSGYGFNYLLEFRRFPFPTYVYQIEDCLLEKEIILVYGQNTVLIRYRLTNENGRRIAINLFPLVTSRDYHWTTRRNDWPFEVSIPEHGRASIEAYPGAPRLHFYTDRAELKKAGFWYFNLFYDIEAARGLDAVEDLYCPLRVNLEGDSSIEFWLAASAEEQNVDPGVFCEYREKELGRLKGLIKSTPAQSQLSRVLALAADSFLVRRENIDSLTVIAGYPWFADWGRDAMIALPGLTLPTRRWADFRQVVHTFLAFEKDGLLPNLFPDDGSPPAYNTADAAMWSFWCLFKYLQYTGDLGFLQAHYPVLVRILERHMHGTEHGIRMDRDCLITQGAPFKALTWMDAKVGDEVITPRRGKTVEINALWCFALSFVCYLASQWGDDAQARQLRAISLAARKSFREKFWNQEGGYLFDLIGEEVRDDSLRCNQIIALSLPIRLLEPEQERQVLRTVWQHLYAGYGLRSLSPSDHRYRGRYLGNQHERDSAYHQGTVWVWPWGHFVTALNRIYGETEEARQITRRLLTPLVAHLHEGCLGSVSEIFDGDQPRHPRGCFAQAWSVGELLRVVFEEVERRLPESDLAARIEAAVTG